MGRHLNVFKPLLHRLAKRYLINRERNHIATGVAAGTRVGHFIKVFKQGVILFYS